MKESPLQWSALIQPVKEDEVPALKQYIHTGIKVLSLSTPPCMLLLLLGQWLYSPLIWERALFFYGILTLESLTWYFVLRSSKIRDPSFLHTIHVGLTLLTLSMQGWFHVNGQHPFSNGSFTALAVTVLVCPMSPKHFMALGVITIFGECIGVALADGDSTQYILKALAGIVTTFYVLFGTRIIRALLKTRDQSQRQLVAAERLGTLGRHTASIAHELKTPLASVNLGIYAMEDLHKELQESIGHPDVNEEDLREIGQELQNHLHTIKEGTKRSVNFVTALREHTQQMHQHQTSHFSPEKRLESVSTLLRNIYPPHKVHLQVFPLAQEIALVGDAGKFDQIIINLVNNAAEACLQHKMTNCEIVIRPYIKGKTFVLIVQDNGPGVPETMKEQIFASMFTTKGDEGGTGLGLSMCRDIAEGVFGGSLTLADSTIGARFMLSIPLHTQHTTKTNTLTFSPFPKTA